MCLPPSKSETKDADGVQVNTMVIQHNPNKN